MAGNDKLVFVSNPHVRILNVFVLALIVIASCRAAEPVALAVLDCGKQVRSIGIVSGTVHVETVGGLPADKGNCVVWDALRFPGNQAVVLVNDEHEEVPDSIGAFELHLYSLPGWKLEAKRTIPGKLPHDNYLLPSYDRQSVVVVSLSDETHQLASRLAYRVGGVMEPLPVEQVKVARAVIIDDPALPLLRAGAKATDLPNVPAYNCVAQTGDAVLEISFDEPKKGSKQRVPPGHVAVYSMESGKEIASMNVPIGMNDDAKCIALWHSQVAIFSLPQEYVILDLAKGLSKVVKHDFKVFNKHAIYPLWIERDADGVAKKQ